MKKRLALLLAAAMTISAGVCTVYAEDAAAEEKGELMMATTTSTADTGLLDYLAPVFKEDTGWEKTETLILFLSMQSQARKNL